MKSAATKSTKKVSRESRLKQFAKSFEKEGMGKVEQIVRLAKKNFTRAEIIEAGFNKNTVHRQVREKVDLA